MALEKKIELEVNNVELVFNVNLAAYDKYIDELVPNQKKKPATNFLTSTVASECKEALLKMFQSSPGVAIHLCASVIDEYQPDFDIAVKK